MKQAIVLAYGRVQESRVADCWRTTAALVDLAIPVALAISVAASMVFLAAEHLR